MRSRLRTLIPDVYKDVSYVLDEDGYATAEYQDIVRKRFIKVWEGLTDGYKVSFMVFMRLNLTLAGFMHRKQLSYLVWSGPRCYPPTMGEVYFYSPLFRGMYKTLDVMFPADVSISWVQYALIAIFVP